MSGVPRRYFLEKLGMKGFVDSVKGLATYSREPGHGNFNPHSIEQSETELMDEDANELQAQITNNPYDLEIFGGDVTTQRNFGTVDNPVLVFSANVGWRYVQCHGIHDEEEGHQHSQVWFILREGPMHRCHACGQVFKLVNLPDAITPESDYYQEHFMYIPEEEMGDDEDWMQRWTWHNFAKPYPVVYPFQNSHKAFVLVNNDEHDRLLTDPAYRLAKLEASHEVLDHQVQALLDIEERVMYHQGHQFPKAAYTLEDYRDLVVAESQIRKLDDILYKVGRFNRRAHLDPDSHDRRQKRMEERAALRKNEIRIWNSKEEAELQYNDYFESEGEQDLAAEKALDAYEELYASQVFDFEKYEFIEEGTTIPQPPVRNLFVRRAFKFENRMWQDPPHVFFARQQRMISRFFERKRNTPEFDVTTIQETMDKEGYIEAVKVAMPYRDYIADEAVQQYKDYYETDQEDLEDFQYMNDEERLLFARIYTDHSKRPEEGEVLKLMDINEEKGLSGVTEALQSILPQVKAGAKKAVVQEFIQGKESGAQLDSKPRQESIPPPQEAEPKKEDKDSG